MEQLLQYAECIIKSVSEQIYIALESHGQKETIALANKVNCHIVLDGDMWMCADNNDIANPSVIVGTGKTKYDAIHSWFLRTLSQQPVMVKKA